MCTVVLTERRADIYWVRSC